MSPEFDNIFTSPDSKLLNCITQKKPGTGLETHLLMQGTLAQPPNPTPLEKFRHDIQQKFVVYKRKSDISQKEMAELLGVDEGKVSKILRNRLDDFSTDRLITLYEKINPKVKLKVS